MGFQILPPPATEPYAGADTAGVLMILEAIGQAKKLRRQNIAQNKLMQIVTGPRDQDYSTMFENLVPQKGGLDFLNPFTPSQQPSQIEENVLDYLAKTYFQDPLERKRIEASIKTEGARHAYYEARKRALEIPKKSEVQKETERLKAEGYTDKQIKKIRDIKRGLKPRVGEKKISETEQLKSEGYNADDIKLIRDIKHGIKPRASARNKYENMDDIEKMTFLLKLEATALGPYFGMEYGNKEPIEPKVYDWVQKEKTKLEILNPDNFGARPDGTQKGKGFLGVLPTKGGGVATEYSVGVRLEANNGQETDIPTLVPTLTKQEIDLMVNDIIPNRKKVPQKILQKAVDHANKRVRAGKSPFLEPGETKAITEPDRIKVISPNGQTGTIPASQLEEAKKQGYKVVE